MSSPASIRNSNHCDSPQSFSLTLTENYCRRYGFNVKAISLAVQVFAYETALSVRNLLPFKQPADKPCVLNYQNALLKLGNG